MNYKQLSKILRYTFTTKEDFEKSIDANPLESNNHLIYADWLDEHDEPEEAEFRRVLGRWIQDKKDEIGDLYKHYGLVGYGLGGQLGFPGNIQIHDLEYPRSNRTEWSYSPDIFNEGYENNPTYPSGWVGELNPHIISPYMLRWSTYRGFEQALRQAFKNSKKREQNG